ncbi:hypothetical protein [Nocardioides sediminis]|uniref:hypothetical protein n=1 Tax=Nocardioides sediminis TaxID=433648 RepID=UPI00131F413D|nr:hypothetical protein [Nocardioides sediminis]
MTTYADDAARLPTGTTPGDRPGRGAGFWVRTVLATGFGMVAAGLLALAGVLAVFAVVVVTPEQPGRALAALTSVPELRHDAAESLVADVEEERGRPFAPGTREVLVAAADDALGDPAVLDALGALRIEDGRLDPTPYVAAISDELGRQAAATDDPEARRVLSTFADELPEVVAGSEVEGGEAAEGLGFARGLEVAQRWGLITSAVVAVVGVIAGLVATAVAVHRGLTAALVPSAALVVAALALAPGEWLLGFGNGAGGVLAHLVAAAGAFAGSGLVWSLLLASLVPPALWWAVRSARTAS